MAIPTTLMMKMPFELLKNIMEQKNLINNLANCKLSDQLTEINYVILVVFAEVTYNDCSLTQKFFEHGKPP